MNLLQPGRLTTKTEVGPPSHCCWETFQLFADAECDELLAALSKVPSAPDGAYTALRPIRSVGIPVEPFRTLYERVWVRMAEENAKTWRYELDGWLSLALLRYAVGAEFAVHTDLGDPRPRDRHLKLAMSCLLSEPADYRGGELVLTTGIHLGGGAVGGPEFIVPLHRRGTAVVFPSFIVHAVTPVISGERVVLVGRAGGPAFA